jgi:hypothetical protein
MPPATITSRRPTETGEMAPEVLGAMKAWLAVVAALNDVPGNTNETETGLARQGRLLVARTGDAMDE